MKKMDDVFDLPLSATNNLIFTSYPEYPSVECNYDEDAEAIVLAVNSHDKLVEALQEITGLESSREDEGNLIAKRALESIIK